MGWDNTLFGHITNVLALCFWCGMSWRGPTAESLIKRDLPVKYIASHEILIRGWSSLWPINYQEDRSRRKVRGRLLSLEESSWLELRTYKQCNLFERYEESNQSELIFLNVCTFYSWLEYFLIQLASFLFFSWLCGRKLVPHSNKNAGGNIWKIL